MAKLDKRSIGGLPGPAPGKFDLIHWDAELPGFGLRVLSSGTRSWVVRYRLGRRQRVITFAKAAALDPDKARRQAGEILAKAKLGQDARVEIAERKAAASAPAALAMGELIERYLAFKKPKMRGRSWDETARHLRKHAAPLHALALEHVRRRNLAALFMDLADANGGSAANHVRASISALFTWAITSGLVELESNPVASTIKAGKEGSRERTLKAVELRAIWEATSGASDYDKIVRLLILTGARRAEVAGLAWGELDFDKAEWLLPGARSKNSREHLVPLSEPVLAILREVPRRPGRALLFGEGERPFSGFGRGFERTNGRIARARAKAAGIEEPDAKALAKHALPPWTVHDIRRTVVTMMGEELAIPPHVVEAVVNHVSGHKAGVAGIYNRATYAAEKRQALARWADHVMALVAGQPSNVVPLRRETA